MSTREVLEIVERRGLKIALKNGQPVLERAQGSREVTDKLLSVLKFHREKIIALLSKEKPS